MLGRAAIVIGVLAVVIAYLARSPLPSVPKTQWKSLPLQPLSLYGDVANGAPLMKLEHMTGSATVTSRQEQLALLTYIHSAIKAADFEYVMEMMYSYKGALNLIDDDGLTSLHRLALETVPMTVSFSGSDRLAQHLEGLDDIGTVMLRDSSLNTSSGSTLCALQLSSRLRTAALTSKLVRNGVEGREICIRQVDPASGKTPLHNACGSFGWLAAALTLRTSDHQGNALLLNHTFDFEVPVRDMKLDTLTALQAEGYVGHMDVVHLVALGADIKAVDGRGNTALHYAARNGRSRLAEWLLLVESSLAHVKNNVGRTALDLATAADAYDVVNVLRPLSPVKESSLVASFSRRKTASSATTIPPPSSDFAGRLEGGEQLGGAASAQAGSCVFDVVHVSDLTAALFMNDYVDLSRPLLVLEGYKAIRDFGRLQRDLVKHVSSHDAVVAVETFGMAIRGTLSERRAPLPIALQERDFTTERTVFLRGSSFAGHESAPVYLEARVNELITVEIYASGSHQSPAFGSDVLVTALFSGTPSRWDLAPPVSAFYTKNADQTMRETLESHQFGTCTLREGDTLYIPADWGRASAFQSLTTALVHSF